MRSLRGSLVGLAAVLLGAGGHALAGGALPEPHVLVVCLAVACAVGTALSGRRWSVPALLLTLGLGQVGLHLAMSGEGHLMAGMAAGARADLPMVAAHLLATVLSAVVLAHGDAWCARLADLLAGSLRLPAEVDVIPVAAVPAGAAHTPDVRRLWWTRSQPRRGPPVLAHR